MYNVKVNQKEEFFVEIQGTDTFVINEKIINADVQKLAENRFHVLIENKGYSVEILKNESENKKATLLINGNKYTTETKDKYDLLLSKLGMNVGTKLVKNMKAPMPGLVLDILVKPGEIIKSKQALLVLEAMKMENVLKAPADAVVKSIEVNKGVTVEKNQVLIHFE